MTRALTPRVPVHLTANEIIPVFGLWRLREAVILNGLTAAAGDFLVPARDGRWQLHSVAGETLDGVFPPGHLPTEHLRAGLRALAASLDDDDTLHTWLVTPPLPPDLRGELVLRPLERSIELHLGHIEEIIRTPQTRLLLEIERVHVSRARRVPALAIRRLAAHTEDWERRTLNAPRPRHILSELRSEHLDIYENRVVARLLDHLRDYLNKRIGQVRNVLQTLRSIHEFGTDEGTNHWMARRICRLWGEKYSRDVQLRDEDEQLIHRLEHLRRRVLRMQDSPLYRAIPRLGKVERHLRSSNILAHDRHYRSVHLLWDLWVRDVAAREPSPAHLHAQDQQLCRDMATFAALLVVRALDQLGYHPADESDQHFGVGRSVTFTLGSDTLTVEWRIDDCLTIRADTGEVQVVALPAALADAGPIRRLRPAAPLLLLHLERQDAPDILRSLDTLDNDPRNCLRPGLSVLPVSPYTLTSVERVARWLRWTLTGAAFRAYPPALRAPPKDWSLKIDALRLDDKQVHLVRPLPPHDSALRHIENKIATQRTELARLKGERQVLQEGRKGRLDDHRERSQMNERITAVNHEINTREPGIKLAEAFIYDLARARREVVKLCRCPTCGQVVPPDAFAARNDRTFIARCIDCGTRWGTRRCGAGHAIPFIEPPDQNEQGLPAAEWIERVVGCDILALPLADKPGWLCPDCPPPMK